MPSLNAPIKVDGGSFDNPKTPWKCLSPAGKMFGSAFCCLYLLFMSDFPVLLGVCIFVLCSQIKTGFGRVLTSPTVGKLPKLTSCKIDGEIRNKARVCGRFQVFYLEDPPDTFLWKGLQTNGLVTISCGQFADFDLIPYMASIRPKSHKPWRFPPVFD